MSRQPTLGIPLALAAALALSTAPAAAFAQASFEPLGRLRPDDGSNAWAVSADGRVVVGQADGATGSQAFRWTPEGGIAGLGSLAPGGSSIAFGVNADGSVVVGQSDTPAGSFHTFRWTPQAGMQPVPELPGTLGSIALDVSPDGSTIVGEAVMREGSAEPFRWTEAKGMELLHARAADGFKEMARAVSADGNIVVGTADFGPFIWDPKNGFRNLRTVLVEDYGLGDALAGWRLDSVEDISADGTTLVGDATDASRNFQAYRVTLPEPTAAALLAPCLPLLLRRQIAPRIRR